MFPTRSALHKVINMILGSYAIIINVDDKRMKYFYNT